jgi:hypothetical protein
VGKSEPTKKGKIEYYFLQGARRKGSDLFDRGVRGFNAWSSKDYDLKFNETYDALLDVESFGKEISIRLKALPGVAGGAVFDEPDDDKF